MLKISSRIYKEYNFYKKKCKNFYVRNTTKILYIK